MSLVGLSVCHYFSLQNYIYFSGSRQGDVMFQFFHCNLSTMRQLTGCFIWKIAISNGCRTKKVHFWPYVGKGKMCLRSSNLKIFLHFPAVCLHFFSTTVPKIHFRFTNIVSIMHSYSTAIWNRKISNDTLSMPISLKVAVRLVWAFGSPNLSPAWLG